MGSWICLESSWRRMYLRDGSVGGEGCFSEGERLRARWTWGSMNE